MIFLPHTEKFFALYILLFANMVFAGNDCQTINKIENALKNGKAVAVIVADPGIKENIRFSDAYGDWVHYWNDFITETDNKFLHLKITPTQLPLIFSHYQVFEKPISYVFISKDAAFYYPGAIYEPQIYLYVQLKFSGKPIPKDVAPFKPENIKIRLLHCDK